MKNTARIGLILIVSACFFVAEITVGFKTRSLALIADSFHYLNDLVAYAMAFFASYLQERGQHTDRFTYAFHRAELLGAFFNGVFLMGLALSMLLQSVERFFYIETIDSPKLVLIIGVVGLILNIISALFFHGSHHGHNHSHSPTGEAIELNTNTAQQHDPVHASHHHRKQSPARAPNHDFGHLGVLLHILGDAVNNIGVIIIALIIMKLTSPQRFYADPAMSLFISLVIFASAIALTYRTGRTLLDASPIHLDLFRIKEDLQSVPNVLSVHDFHVWHLSQMLILGSLHVCVPLGMSLEQWETTEHSLQLCFEEYGISHVTISPEIHRDSPALPGSSEDLIVGGCRLLSKDDFGCAVGSDLKKRRGLTGAV